MWLRKVRPTPSMVVAMAALVASMSGVAFAQVRDNSVRSGDIRNGNVRAADIATGAVGRAEIRRDAVGTSELARNAVIGENVAENQIGGREILESSLGKIPTAGNADHANRADLATRAFSADTLGGRPASGFITNQTLVPIYQRLNFGEKREIVTNGPIGLEADCRENIAAQGQDELRLLAVTRQDGAFMQGDTPHSGPGGGANGGNHLNNDTPEDSRTMGGVVSIPPNPDSAVADDDIDTGFVAGPNGEYIGIGETTMYAIHVGTSDCLLAGSAVVLGP